LASRRAFSRFSAFLAALESPVESVIFRAIVPPEALLGLEAFDAFDAFAAELADAGAFLLPFRYCAGSTAEPLRRTSKCTCGPVQLPVHPTYPMTSPIFTYLPTEVPKRDMWA
jgi:hypothetical protein